MSQPIGNAPAGGPCAAWPGGVVGRSRPGHRWRAAKGSRCRTRSWNCDARCRRCRISRDGAAAVRPISAVARIRRHPAGGGDLVAQLLSRVDALEEQVRQLRGRIDETQNQVQRQGADLGKRIEDMAFQTQNPQGGAPRADAAAAQPPPPPSNLPLTAAAELPRGTAVRAPATGRHRSGARRNWRSRRAMPRWRGATIRPPNRRRARC